MNLVKRLRLTSAGVLIASMAAVPAIMSAPIAAANGPSKACYRNQFTIYNNYGAFTASSEGSGTGTGSYEPLKSPNGANDLDVGKISMEWNVHEAVTGNAAPVVALGDEATPGSMSGALEAQITVKKGNQELRFHGTCIAEANLENAMAGADLPTDPADQVLEAEFEGRLDGSYTPPKSCMGGCPAIKSGDAVASIVINAINHKVIAAKVTIETGETCSDGPNSLSVAVERPNVKGSLEYTGLPAPGFNKGRQALPDGVSPFTMAGCTL